MPRGFKRDEPLTMRLYENGLFLDKRSFVGYDSDRVPHLLLFGEDMKAQRDRVWKRDKGRCQVGGKRCQEIAHEMDHKKGGLSGRCDCQHNLQSVCMADHREKHVHPKWGVNRADGIKDFNKLYPEEKTT